MHPHEQLITTYGIT